MNGPRFPVLSRLLHWLMALMILAMLFIGIGMVSSLGDYHWLLSIHRPLGIAILVLVAVRLANRQINPPPPLPADMPAPLRVAAHASHIVLYGLMFAVPLVGWAMLSAARAPIVLYGTLELPPILPQDVMVYAWLREAHTVLALALFAVFLLHLAAALLHALVFRDGVWGSMASPRGGRGTA
ncbi:cytochrome b [Ancylobacter dichloromethanicus]|uniref:Cytochrome b n=1 Tax=Ancylobacter dichloromethanicus TaxID=518825 RepID=A0A9W6JC96_9HYPH|nr:cytochrome b/b6 domain-containing protein [Ancylobacter dichloromethanicus]MBS7554982.1 cytochrome b [Ancylobacter dichloromethanicus]GLK73379.1 cytochrome b [Ancylobacter dichloromethanicus]